MHILRNGQLRLMTRDSRLPTGVVVTKDGFLLGPDGTRTELREGQACDLQGNVVAVTTAAGGAAWRWARSWSPASLPRPPSRAPATTLPS